MITLLPCVRLAQRSRHTLDMSPLDIQVEGFQLRVQSPVLYFLLVFRFLVRLFKKGGAG